MLDIEKQLTTELQKMNIVSSAVESMQDSVARSEKTVIAMDKMADTARIFKPVGRMFVLTSKADIKAEFAKNIKALQDDITENKVPHNQRYPRL